MAAGGLDMDDVTADVRLTAARSDGGCRLADRRGRQMRRPRAPLVGDLTEDAACAATLAILGAVAALGRKGRARDLDRSS